MYGEWVDAAGKLATAIAMRHAFSDFVFPLDAVAQEEGSASRPIYAGPSRVGARKHVDEEDEGNDYEGEGIVADDVIDDD